MLGSIVSGIGSVLGGVFGAKSTKDANAENIKMQQRFAKNAIQWKVKDAEAAGVHPLYALGAQTHSFAPSSVGDTSLPAAMSDAGQHLGRAVNAVASAPERALSAKMASLAVKRAELENDLLASRIATTLGAGVGPATPSANTRYLIDGQGDTASGSLVTTSPMERTVSEPGRGWQEPAAVADVGYTRTQTGYHPVYSNDAKQRLEDDTIGMLLWNLRNRLLPEFFGGASSPPYPAPAGDHWRYHPSKQEYQRRSSHNRKGGGW